MLTLFVADGAGTRLRRRPALRHRALRRALPPPARQRGLRRAVTVRGDVRLAGARRRGDRRGRWTPLATFFAAELWDAHRGRGGGARARSGDRRCDRASSASSSRSSRRSARSASRSGWRRSTRATCCTTGGRACSRRPTATTRCCSATTSTRTGSSASRRCGRSSAVADLAELISLCAQLRAERAWTGDGAAWAATAALLGLGRLDPGRGALRREATRAAARAGTGARGRDGRRLPRAHRRRVG